MKCLITGINGFIGGHLATKLAKDGWDVYGIDNNSGNAASKADLSDEKIKVMEGDLKDPSAALYAIQTSEPEVIFHMAASVSVPDSMRNPSEFLLNNVQSTINILEGIRKTGANKIVFSSSSSVYGDMATRDVREEMARHAKQLSPYALSKMLCENILEHWTRISGVSCIALRYFNVYGPRCRGVIGQWSGASKIVQFGNTLRDYTHVSDVVSANIAAHKFMSDEKFQDFEAINVGKGRADSLTFLAEQMGVHPTCLPSNSYDVKEISANITKLRVLLRIEPSADFDFRGMGGID